ncbi:MAG: chemotaxis protein CheC [Candidatus Omnitrophota bacterium]
MKKKEQYDILCEVGNICAGNAAVALSELLKSPISVSMPALHTVGMKETQKIIKAQANVIGIHVKVFAGLKGEVLLIFTEESAANLIDVFMRSTEQKSSGLLTEIGMSLLKETGNIVISAYVGVLSVMLKTPVIHSTPTLSNGATEDVLQFAFSHQHSNYIIILIEAVFKSMVHEIKSSFYLALTSKSANLIIKELNKQTTNH